MTFQAFQVLCLALAENNFTASDSGWEEGLNHSCEPVHKGAMQVERLRGLLWSGQHGCQGGCRGEGWDSEEEEHVAWRSLGARRGWRAGRTSSWKD